MAKKKGMLKKQLSSHFRERTNLPDYDWSINELSADGNYHELECKPISKTAKHIIFFIEGLSSGTRYIRLREPEEDYEITYLRISFHENYHIERTVMLRCNDDGKIE